MTDKKVFNRSPEEIKQRQKEYARAFKERNPTYRRDLSYNWLIENRLNSPNSKMVPRPDPRLKPKELPLLPLASMVD